MCLPLAPLGALMVVVDLICLGRCLPLGRFGLSLIGLLTFLLGIVLMTGTGSGRQPVLPDGQQISLVQWNLKWGGVRGGVPRNDETWAGVTEQLDTHNADILVLSEAPPRFDADEERMNRERRWLTSYLEKNQLNSAMCEHTPGSEWWYRMAVCSRWPVRKEKEFPIFNGYALSVVVETPARQIRIWVVDGQSNIQKVSRTPMLNELRDLCELAALQNEPVDIIAGDFNTPRRCVGFDDWDEMAGGYELSSRASVGWRGSWPRLFPLWDIDHVWLRRTILLNDCTMFHPSASDHRGQCVRFTVSR